MQQTRKEHVQRIPASTQDLCVADSSKPSEQIVHVERFSAKEVQILGIAMAKLQRQCRTTGERPGIHDAVGNHPPYRGPALFTEHSGMHRRLQA